MESLFHFCKTLICIAMRTNNDILITYLITTHFILDIKKTALSGFVV